MPKSHFIVISGILSVSLFATAQAQRNPSVELVAQPCVAIQSLRVAVFADGRVQLNGKLIPVDQFAASAKLSASNAKEVCLHRQNPEATEPHPNMMVVLDGLVKLNLPIAFYWDAQFQKRVVLNSLDTAR